MHRLQSFFFFLILAFGTALPVSAQWGTPTENKILSPVNGEALQGMIPIIGITDVDGMISWELSFSYNSNPSNTWFLIKEGDQAANDEILTEWDTTTITDGEYQLRLLISLADNETTSALISDLRIRNYTIIGTSIPELTPTMGSLPAIELTSLPQLHTPTPLPDNPLEVSERDIVNSLASGVLTAFTLIILIGLYASIRKKIH